MKGVDGGDEAVELSRTGRGLGLVLGHPHTDFSDIQLGALRIRPGVRVIEGPSGSISVEPLVMRLLVELSRRAGSVVTRQEIFDCCWGSGTVGDDSLNRVVAGLRRSLDQAGRGLASVETVPRTGYLLRLHPMAAGRSGELASPVTRAIQEARDSLRLGWPEPDLLRLEMLRQAAQTEPDNAQVWGLSAQLCRQAAEYAEGASTSEYVARCEEHARAALALDPDQCEAKVALASVAPLFGRWMDARSRLAEIARQSDYAFVAAHELAIAEMATGRVTPAKALVDSLIADDPLAACLTYKSAYQHWSIGDHAGMDHVADRAIHLWPTHPAIWTARFWTLAFTRREHAALNMLEDAAVRPNLPPPLLRLLRAAVSAKLSGDIKQIEAVVAGAHQAAHAGPIGATQALFAHGLLDRLEDQVTVAFAYYLREGPSPVPVRRGELEPAMNEQHRRGTQILFTPCCAAFRRDERFLQLCERMGLAAYWRDAGLTPDFLA